jgi:hypothetical protein
MNRLSTVTQFALVGLGTGILSANPCAATEFDHNGNTVTTTTEGGDTITTTTYPDGFVNQLRVYADGSARLTEVSKNNSYSRVETFDAPSSGGTPLASEWSGGCWLLCDFFQYWGY